MSSQKIREVKRLINSGEEERSSGQWQLRELKARGTEGPSGEGTGGGRELWKMKREAEKVVDVPNLDRDMFSFPNEIFSNYKSCLCSL